MEALAVNYTYGEALFGAADDLGKIDVFTKGLDEISEIFRQNKDFYQLLKSPIMPVYEQKEMLDKVFKGKLDPELLNFLKVLSDKMRMASYEGIVHEYKKLVDKKDGFAKGVVYSAVAIPEDKLESLEKETGKLLHKTIKLENEIDEDLIGGVKIYISGKLIDASIRRSLDDLKERIIS